MQFRVQKYNDNDTFLKTLGKAYAVNLAGSAGLITGIYLAIGFLSKKSKSDDNDTTAPESPEND